MDAPSTKWTQKIPKTTVQKVRYMINNQIKNTLIQDYQKADKIKHQQTKLDALYQLQSYKERLFKNEPIEDLKEFNERIYPQSPRYGILYA